MASLLAKGDVDVNAPPAPGGRATTSMHKLKFDFISYSLVPPLGIGGLFFLQINSSCSPFK